MKRLQTLLIGLFCLFVTLAALAHETVTVHVTGLQSKAVTQNAIVVLSSLQDQLQAPIRRADIVDFTYQALPAIKKALKPFGYFHPHTHRAIGYYDGHWVAHFTITPGPRMRVTTLDLKITGEGAHNKHFIHLMHHFPVKTGSFLNSKRYEDAKQALFDEASEHGFFHAKMEQSKIVINLKTYTAKIILHFSTGPRFRFGMTHFSDTPFSPHFLVKFITYVEGHYYTYKKIASTRKNLINSSYFNQVLVTLKPNHAHNGHVPILITLTPKKRRQYMFGAGYGTDTGIRGTLGIHYRYINRYGHSFKALLQASQRNSNFTASYMIPGPRPTVDHFALSAGYGNINQSTGTSEATKVSASYITTLWGINQTAALTYLNENYNIINLPRTNAQLVYPSIAWKFRVVDKETNIQNGIRLTMTLAGAPDSFTAKNSGFLQSIATGKALVTFKPTHTRFVVRGEVGRTDIGNLNNLPLSLQLFAGGASSVRGFGYNSIGPGRNIVVGSAEIQQRFYKQFYIAGFIDAGNVGNNYALMMSNINVGVGPALVWLSPVGQLELSVAKPISPVSGQWKLQFSMGAVL